MTALKKFILWRLVALIGLFVAAIYAAGQSLAIASLSPFTEEAAQRDSIALKASSYLIVSAVLFVFDLWMLVQTIRRINHT